MNLLTEEKNLLTNYIPTLKRYFLNNNEFKYFKNPFIEKFIFKLVLIHNDEDLISKIIDKINDDIITNEDIFFSFNYYCDFSKKEKFQIQKFLNDFEENEMILVKFKTNIILFLIKYYQYFYVINELLYDNNEEELFYAIYLFSKNNENDIKNYSKKYFKMKIFFYLMDDLLKIYKKNIEILTKNDIIHDLNSFKIFVKNIFFNWHLHYKSSLENDSFENIQNKFKIKENIFYKIVCSHNLC